MDLRSRALSTAAQALDRSSSYNYKRCRRTFRDIAPDINFSWMHQAAPASPGSRPVMKCVARFQATRVLCENVGGRLMELSWPKNTNARQQTNSGVSGRNVEYRQRQHQCLADEVAVRRWPRSDLLLQRGRRDPARGKAERRHVWLRTRRRGHPGLRVAD